MEQETQPAHFIVQWRDQFGILKGRKVVQTLLQAQRMAAKHARRDGQYEYCHCARIESHS